MTEHRRIAEFVALGKPEPKGSTRTFTNPKTQRTIVTSDNPALKAWTKTVRTAAMVALGLDDEGQARPVDAPIYMRLTFRLVRPATHYRANGTLKPSAPEFPVGRPDRDKLERAVGDALTGIVYSDDSRIVDGRTTKLYADPRLQGVRVEVYRIGAEPLTIEFEREREPR